jgi:predicted CXXCH cytochrome family protein
VKLLLVFRTPRPGGRTAQTKKTVTADWVRIGRNASCEIHLPDPRVALEQGMIVNREGPVYIEGESGSQDITRKSVRSVRLKPGEPIDIGPYRLEALAAPPGYDGAVAIEMVKPGEVAAGLAGRFSRTTLASVGLTKRRIAWICGAAILLVFLAVPAGRVLDLPWRDAAQNARLGDRFWNPGPVLLAHQPIESRCGACHESAFQHVKDGACLSCHANIGHHVAPALQPAALFEGARCATCHREHKGVKATHRDDDRLCVDCHADLRAHAAGAKARNASDFAAAHPAFELAPAPASNLKYPHAVHVDPKGVRSPAKGTVHLDCASCHRPDASRRMFEPVTFAKHCQECHRLEIEPAMSAREVPHGKPADAAAMIDEFYANLALRGVRDSFTKAFGVPGEGLLRRVGEATPAAREEALRLASRKARRVADELFEVRVCVTCHEVSRQPEWSVAPVHASHRWMPHARFDHKSHAQQKCVDCHDVSRSKSASDVAMPKIEACRECHGGSRPAERKVTSNCLLCHGFHESGHPWKAGAKPARVAKGAADGG